MPKILPNTRSKLVLCGHASLDRLTHSTGRLERVPLKLLEDERLLDLDLLLDDDMFLLCYKNS